MESTYPATMAHAHTPRQIRNARVEPIRARAAFSYINVYEDQKGYKTCDVAIRIPEAACASSLEWQHVIRVYSISITRARIDVL
jgi:hypothetical protein